MITDEEQPLRDQHWLVQPDETVLDIGCYHGAWTLPALAAGAHVHAFDADPDAIATLKANAQGNEDRLTATAVCVGAPYPPALKAQVQRLRPAMTPNGHWTTIDTYCHRITVDRIKIDIEGGEAAALVSAKQTLARDHPDLVIEEHGLIYPWLEQHRCLDFMLDLLANLGYDDVQVSQIDGYDLTPRHIIATAR